MSNKKEVVVCAAIKVSYMFVNDWNTGLKSRIYHLICGITYDSIRGSSLFRERRFNYSEGFKGEDGFVTNTNRFVNPQEALIISGRGREMRFQDRNYLLPEDLY